MCLKSYVKTSVQSNGESIAYQVWRKTIKVALFFLFFYVHVGYQHEKKLKLTFYTLSPILPKKI